MKFIRIITTKSFRAWFLSAVLIMTPASFSVAVQGAGQIDLPPSGPDQGEPRIMEYVLPTPNSLLYGIGVDSRGRVWYTAQASNIVGFFDPKTRRIKEYKIPSAAELPKSDWQYDPAKKETPKPEDIYNIFSVGSPGELAIDSKDRIWFVQTLGNRIGVFDPETEKFIEYEIPTAGSQPYSLALDRANNVWFIERNANKIGKLDFSTGKVVEYAIKEGQHRLSSIAIDKKDNIWVTDISDNSVGLFDPREGSIERFPISERVSQPQAVVIGPRGQVWFAMAKAHKIAMLDPESKRITVAIMPGYNSVPIDIELDALGRVWYVDNFRNMIGYFDPREVRFREWEIPTTNAQPMQIAIGANGDVWFTESDLNANKIAGLIASKIPATTKAVAGGQGGYDPGYGKESEPDGEDAGQVPLWAFGLVFVAVVFLVVKLSKNK